jgi:hypothetical protein
VFGVCLAKDDVTKTFPKEKDDERGLKDVKGRKGI